MNPTDVRRILTALGWPATVPLDTAVRAFQGGYALGQPLTVDGVVGPMTSHALQTSGAAALAGHPTAAPHFSFREFACGCGGRYHCPVIWVRRELLAGLERFRAVSYPQGLGVESGCRCATHNHEVGGAPDSQHLYGAAADVPYAARWETVRELGVFSGIGRSANTGLVRHVDVRASSGHNVTGGSPTSPTIWNYAA